MSSKRNDRSRNRNNNSSNNLDEESTEKQSMFLRKHDVKSMSDNSDSHRELRNVQRKSYRRPQRSCRTKNMLYDEDGILLESNNDMCDCLQVSCPGCHFPCVKCGSSKCGTECRCNRKWAYESIHVEGRKTYYEKPT